MRHCSNCGQPLAPGANFCRSCGARYAAPAAPAPGRSHGAIWIGAAIVFAGAVAALAIVFASGGSSKTTVVVDGERAGEARDSSSESSRVEPTGSGAVASDSVEAGHYVQAGSFRTAKYAEIERQRLAGEGIEVTVASSDGAQELYPGLRVLLSEPLTPGGSAEASMLSALRRNGVPSAFARDLTPARAVAGPEEAAGSWSGVLDRTSGERPGLSGQLAATVEMDAEGRTGTLAIQGGRCVESLTLTETTETTLSYRQSRPCAAAGDLLVRPIGTGLMLSLLPLDSDVLVLGTLTPG